MITNKKAKQLKTKQILGFILIIVGFLTLYFFPEPETNFVAYVVTAAVFTAALLLVLKKRDMN